MVKKQKKVEVKNSNNLDKTQQSIPQEKIGDEPKYWRFVFWGIAAVLLCLMMINADSVGSGGDDLWYGTNGEFVLRYYLDGDTSCLDYSKIEYHNMTPNFKIKYFAETTNLAVSFFKTNARSGSARPGPLRPVRSGCR